MKDRNYIPAFNFDILTPFYDFFVELLGYGYSQRDKVVKLLKLKKGENLLDVGCGTGTLIIIAKENYPNVDMIGIDIDQKVLRIAKKKISKKGLHIKILEASAGELPFKKNSFDVVVSSLVFHHLPKEVKISALKETYRILKPNGRFLLADFGENGFLVKFWNILSHLLMLPEAKTFEDNVRGLIPVLMEQSGFRIKEVASSYRGIQYLLGRKKIN